MSHTKEILTAVGALGCALGIGFVMQSSDSAAARYGSSSSAVAAEKELRSLSNENAVLEVEDIILTSAEFDIPANDAPVAFPKRRPMQLAAADMDEALPVPGAAPQADDTNACEITAKARSMAAAMVNLTLAAPCLTNERVTVHHNGMIFTQTTSKTGDLDIVVPALAETAVFVFAFGNGDGTVVQTTVEDLADFDRVVLQWKGEAGFQIHALEFGADYNEDGHVWSGAPRGVASAITGEGGFMSMNGDLAAAEPLVAEVYTFPADLEGLNGGVIVSLEAEVIQSNCGQEIDAQTLELRSGDAVVTQDVTFAVPDCDAVGNFLVLNNLLRDLKVASN